MARIAIGGIHHETNTFAPSLATLADFEPIASEVLICVAPGPMVADPGALPWTRLRPGVRIRPNGPAFGVS